MVTLIIILIVMSAICKALADTLWHHYDTSIFKHKNAKWWNPRVSCDHVKFLHHTKYRPDAWHLANSGMIIFFIAAVALNEIKLQWYWQVLAGGVVYNVPFNIFYNKIFR